MSLTTDLVNLMVNGKAQQIECSKYILNTIVNFVVYDVLHFSFTFDMLPSLDAAAGLLMLTPRRMNKLNGF